MRPASFWRHLLGLFLFAQFAPGMARAQTKVSAPYFNVVDYGAHRDGSASSTEAFRAAIAAAQKAGGGTVYVPAGTYVTGPIEMVSDLTLYVDAGATLRFPATILPFTKGRQQGIEALTPVPLIGGHDLANVAVIGRGTLTSNNADWMKLHNRALRTVSDAGSANGPNWEHLLEALDAGKPVSQEEYEAAAKELRPSFIRFMNCKNVRIDGLHIVGSPMWTIHLLYTENAVVENMVIEAFPGVHADGIVVDSSRFVRIANDYIDAGDDGIVLKSGKDADGLRVNRPTENVTITNCTVHHAQGAVVIGSETSGSVRNVVASNITARDTENGIHIKSSRLRGGVVEDIRYDNWTMENVGSAISVSDAGYQMEGEPPDPGQGPVSNRTPVFRNIAISNITVNGAHSLIDVEGIVEMPIYGLSISNVMGAGRSGMRARYTDGMQVSGVRLDPESGPAFEVRDSTNLEMDRVSAPRAIADTPFIRLEKTPSAIVRDSEAPAGMSAFLSIPLDEQGSVVLQGDLLGGAAATVSASDKATWPNPKPQPRELCLVQYDEGNDPTQVSNQAIICLDMIAQTLQRSASARIALIGNTDAPVGSSSQERKDAATRAASSKNYLVQQKGIDPSRVLLYVGSMTFDGPEDIDRIEAEMVAGTLAKNNVETMLLPAGLALNNPGLTPVP
jgi:glycosyl hydrolase family 28/pectate lyase-like protein